MKERQIANRVLIVLALALFILGAMAGTLGAWGVTNFGSVHIADTNTTATPVFLVNNTGPSVIAEFQDSGTPVARILDGGSLELQAGFDLNGQALTIDADADTTLQASIDDQITTTLGAATGSFDIATGNLRVGNGTNNTTLNGEDAYIEGTFEVDGAARFDGAIDANSSMDLAGNLTSATGAVTVADTLNTTGAADFDSTLNVDGAATFNSTVDIDGNLTSGTGSITIADTLNTTGAVDFDSTLNVDSDATFKADINTTVVTTITVTIGIPITPTGTYQPLTITPAEDGTSDIAPGVSGQLLILENMHATHPITIDGTGGTVECKANVPLYPGDTLTLIYDGLGVVWRCLSTYDNS